MLCKLVLLSSKDRIARIRNTQSISIKTAPHSTRSCYGSSRRLFGSKSAPKLQGMITVDDLRHLASSKQVDTVAMAFTDHLGRQMGKRCDIDFFLEEAIAGSYACDYLLTVDMDSNVLPGFKYSNWYVF